uniref:Uncharacterized protein n=1 Tax=Phenylobacterium glaciei TaxID=2803784 RepID=A0A974P5S6_9CAUL|nr:hypothetical protein JKL49_11740 [Phenylobacterium glaciei]
MGADNRHGDPFEIAKTFHANRIDWTYGDAAFIAECVARGFAVGAALSPTMSRPDGDISDRMRDKSGQPVTAPWMKGWQGGRAYWGCFNNPDFRSLILGRARAAVAAGATRLQFDDAAGNYGAVAWGACWCAACRAKAAAQGVDLETGMKRFQLASVRDFFQGLRDGLPANILLSSNNGAIDWNPPYDLFDFGVAEMDEAQVNPQYLFNKFAAIESAGKFQFVTLRSESVDLNRRAIAMIYALGGGVIAPWDVFLRPNGAGSDRFYGAPEDYADQLGVIRQNATWFDDFTLEAALGTGVSRRPDLLQASGPVDLAVLRRAPDGRLVLHVVNASKAAKVEISVKTVATQAQFAATGAQSRTTGEARTAGIP